MNTNKGFTLLEIMIAVTVIVVLTAISLPAIKPMIASHRISSAAQSVRSALQIAKTEAIKNQTTATVNFVEGTGGAAGYTTTLLDGTIIDTATGTMGSTISLYDAEFGGSDDPVAEFNPMGLATDFSGSVVFTDTDNTIFKRVRVTESGNITLEKSSTGATGTFVE